MIRQNGTLIIDVFKGFKTAWLGQKNSKTFYIKKAILHGPWTLSWTPETYPDTDWPGGTLTMNAYVERTNRIREGFTYRIEQEKQYCTLSAALPVGCSITGTPGIAGYKFTWGQYNVSNADRTVDVIATYKDLETGLEVKGTVTILLKKCFYVADILNIKIEAEDIPASGGTLTGCRLVYDIVYNDGSRVYVERLLGISVSALSKGTVESPRTIVRTFSEGELGIITEGSVSKNIPQLTVYQETNTKSCVQTEFDETTHIKVTANPATVSYNLTTSTISATLYYKTHYAKYTYTSGAESGGNISTEQSRNILNNIKFLWVKTDLPISSNNTITIPKNATTNQRSYTFSGTFSGYNALNMSNTYTDSVTVIQSANTLNYTIRWYKNSNYGEWTSGTTTDTYRETSVAYGTSLSICTPPANLQWKQWSDEKITYTGNWSYRTSIDDDVLHGSDTMPDSTLTLYAMYNLDGYKVEFNSSPGRFNFSGLYSSFAYFYAKGFVTNMWHTKAGLPEAGANFAPTVVYDGYTLKGWDGHVAPWDVIISSHVTYTADYNAATSTVIWYANGGKWPDGSVTRTQNITLGSNITSYTPTPTKTGTGVTSTFQYWEYNGSKANFPIVASLSSYTFNAKYNNIPNTYTVTWETGGGYWEDTNTNEDRYTRNVAYGTTYNDIFQSNNWVTYKVGNNFFEWKSQSDDEPLEGNDTLITSDLYVYPYYNKSTIYYNIFFDPNGGYWVDTGTYTERDIYGLYYDWRYDEILEYIDNNFGQVERDKRTFNGWHYMDSNGPLLSSTPFKRLKSQPTTIYIIAGWSEPVTSTIIVRCILNGGNWPDNSTGSRAILVPYNSSYGEILYEVNNKLGTPYYYGKSFKGWADDEGNFLAEHPDINVITSPFDIHAEWSNTKKYKVMYKPNGGYFPSSSVDIPIELDITEGVSYKTIATMVPDPLMPEYAFDSWWTSSDQTGVNLLQSTLTLTGNLVVYAHYIRTYLVYYNLYGNISSGAYWNSDNSTAEKTKEFNVGTTYAEINDNPPDNAHKSGYKLDFWRTDKLVNGSGILLKDNTTKTLTGDLRIYGFWSNNPEQTYTVYYNPNGGYWGSNTSDTANKTLEWDEGSEYGEIADGALTTPNKSGYIFDSWWTSSDNSGKNISSDSTARRMTLTGDLTIYAHYEPEPIITTNDYDFDPNGGKWSDNSTNIKTITLTENSNGEVLYSDIYANRPTPNPTKDGYTFKGWTDPDDNILSSSSSKVSYDSMIIKAIWEPDPDPDPTQYSVSFYPNGGHWGSDNSNTSYKHKTYNANTTLNDIASDCSTNVGNVNFSDTHDDCNYYSHKFNHWNTKSDDSGITLEGNSTKLTSNLSVYAIEHSKAEAAVYYTITYDVKTNGGYWGNNTSDTADKKVLAYFECKHNYSEIIAKQPGTPAHVNSTDGTKNYQHNFKEWNTSADGSTGISITSTNTTKITSSFTVYAIFTKEEIGSVQYTVTYDVKTNGGYWGNNTSDTADKTKSFNANVTYDHINDNPPTFANKADTALYDYTFDYWYTISSGSNVNMDGNISKLTGNLTVYAHFSYVTRSYTITWDPNGGTWNSGGNGNKTTTAKYGDTITTSSAPGTVSKTGNTFTGWYKDTVKLGTVLVSGDMTIKADWSTNTYTVTYDVKTNGGTWDGTNNTNKTKTFSYNSNFAPPDLSSSETPLKAPTVSETFTADYWFTTSNGTTKKSTEDKVTSNFTVYAKFTSSPREYTVTYDVNGGNSISPNTKYFAYGTLYSKIASDAPATPTKSESVFDDWYTAKTGGTKLSDSTSTLTGNLTVYAHWKDYTYEAVFLVQA